MNVVQIQTLLDGPRNTTLKVDVSMDGTGDITIPYTIVNPALLSSSNAGGGPPPPRKVRVDLLDWDVQDALCLMLWWDSLGSPTAFPVWRMVGRSMEKAFHVGGLQNNADNPTGKITLTTVSLDQATRLVGTFKIHCVKQP